MTNPVEPTSAAGSEWPAGRPLVTLDNVSKSYWKDQTQVVVLRDLTFAIDVGEFLAIVGPSGSGKSTLLNLAGALDTPDAGVVRVGGQDLAALNEDRRSRWRSLHVGFIFQQYHLLPVLSAAENVELPLRLYNMTRGERRRRVAAALDVVGLRERAAHRPSQLSGGQEQRVAIARAIVMDPMLLIADEPTGDLDSDSAAIVLDLLTVLSRDLHKTIVMVTHDPRAAAYASRTVRLDKGVLTESEPGHVPA